MQGYNGYTNYATWNVSLWLNNEEPLYRELQRIVRFADDVEELAAAIQELAQDVWPDGKTSDGALLSECNWEELAANEWEDADKDAEVR